MNLRQPTCVHSNASVENPLSIFQLNIFQKDLKKAQLCPKYSVVMHKSANIFKDLPCRQTGNAKVKVDDS